jgi:hypothetical protein
MLQVYAQTNGVQVHPFDGLSLGIINRDNKCLFAHELIRHCWVTLSKTRSSFHAFWAAHVRNCLYTLVTSESVQPDTLQEFLSKHSTYKLFMQACFDWKTLLQVDAQTVFACQCIPSNTHIRKWLYDNGCNTEQSACLRDATMLQNNIIKVDEWHHRSHKDCSPLCGSGSDPCLVTINSSYIEQVNSIIGNAHTSAPHFSQEKWIEYLDGMIFFYNLEQHDKNLLKDMSIETVVKQCDATCIGIKKNKAYIEVPHERPAVVPGQPAIRGVSVADRMMIPCKETRRVLSALLSAQGALLTEAERYLRDSQFVDPVLVPYLQWTKISDDVVRVADCVKPLKPLLKHFASGSCELQNIPAVILDAVSKIASCQFITAEEELLVQMHSPGVSMLLTHDLKFHPNVYAQQNFEEAPKISAELQGLLQRCISKCQNIISSGRAPVLPPPDHGWTAFEKKIRTGTIAPNRPETRSYPDFVADHDLERRKNNEQSNDGSACSKYHTFSRNLVPGLFVVVCVGCRKIELAQMMPSHESPLTAYRAMYLRDWS